MLEHLQECDINYLEFLPNGYWLPIRVLDIVKLDSALSVVKLLETQGKHGTYITLSYC
jgi:hypothetical protein